MSVTVSFKYRAFLSYAHADTKWGTWLHNQLETFRIDKDLKGRVTALGAVPNTLRPIFRDRDDFTGGHALTAATVVALDASAALIVLCSPRSAQSRYVNEEVRLFRCRHPQRPVIPVMIGGMYPRNIPKALLFEIDRDGAITDRPVTLLGVDLREQADGHQLGVAKVVAGLVGVGSDEIFQRAERARRASVMLRNSIIGVLALLTIGAAGSAVYAWQQLKRNDAFLEATLNRATLIVSTAVAQAEKYSVPRGVTLAFLTQAEGLFGDMAHLGRTTPELKRQQAWMLIEFARNYRVLGGTESWRARAVSAQQLMASLIVDNPNDALLLSDLAAAQNEVGDALRAQGKLMTAIENYRAAMLTASRLAAADPTNSNKLHSLSVSLERLGDVAHSNRNFSTALEAHQLSVEIGKALLSANPSDPTLMRSLSISYSRRGDVLLTLGRTAEALEAYGDSLSLAEGLATMQPENLNSQSHLAYVRECVGDALGSLGRLDDSLISYRMAASAVVSIGNSDPTNASTRKAAASLSNKIGDTLAANGNFAAAVPHYVSGLATYQAMTTQDSSNVNNQYSIAETSFRLALMEALIYSDNAYQAKEVAAKLYYLKWKGSEEIFKEARILIVSAFQRARRKDRPRELLQDSVAILKSLDAAGALTPSQIQWASVFASSFAALSR